MATEWISRDDVFAALDMNAVLSHYDIKHGRGSSFRIHCPFHDDERPSCSINRHAKVFNCFSCGEQGNGLDFIAVMEGLDPKAEFRGVLEAAIEIIGHNPTSQKRNRPIRKQAAAKQSENKTNSDGDTKSKNTKSGRPKKNSKRQDKGSSAESEPITGKASKKGKPKKRSKNVRPSNDNHGTDQSVNVAVNVDGSVDLSPNKVLEAPAFPLKLEYAHPWLNERLKQMGVHPSIAEEMGIGFEGRSNALMAGRVCFPIHNAKGELVAYSGRWAGDGDNGKFFTENGREQPRYRLPKGFQKQLELFNWHRVRQQFEGNTSIVLVEGFWSVLRLQAMTIPSVALMGLDLSDAQIRLLSGGGIRSVVVMLDGDEQGQAASQKIVLKLASHFFTRSISLPVGRKPDNADIYHLQQLKALCVENNR